MQEPKPDPLCSSELRRKTEELEQYFTSALDLLCITDTNGFFRKLNPEWERVLGYTIEELQSRRFPDFVHPDDMDATLQAVSRLVEQQTVENFINRYRHKDGTYRWIEWRSYLRGELIYAVARDITECKKIEEALQDSEQKLKAIVYGSPIPQFIINIDHRVIYWNKALEEISGIKSEEAIGTKQHWKAFYGEERPCMADLLVDGTVELLPDWYGDKYRKSKLVDNAYEATDFFPTLGKGGKWLYFTATAIQDSKGNVIGAVETLEDITERKQAEKALQKAYAELEQKVIERTKELTEANIKLKELDRLKSMFISSMSHELRTPLNSIIGFTGIILMGMTGEITEEQRKQLAMVKSSAHHLLDLINEVMDISKVEAGKVELSIKGFDLSSLMKEVKDSFSVAAETKGLKLSLITPDKLFIESDERRIEQVLLNLVINAVKFTDRGEIEIRLEEKDGRAITVVKDTGIGIKKDDMGKLFVAFSQIHTEVRPKEGTGLGLYLAKKIADLLGGELRAESEFGKGSIFTFSLPFQYKRAEA